jgi:hypothetical protein
MCSDDDESDDGSGDEDGAQTVSPCFTSLFMHCIVLCFMFQGNYLLLQRMAVYCILCPELPLDIVILSPLHHISCDTVAFCVCVYVCVCVQNLSTNLCLQVALFLWCFTNLLFSFTLDVQ